MTTPLPENASRPRTKTGPGWPLGLFSVICGVILMAAQPGIWIGMDNMIGDVIVALVLGFMIWLNFRLLHNLPFRVQTTIIWAELLLGFALFFYSFDLSFDFIGSRLPFLLGLRLEGEFLQGAVLTLFISLVSIFCATVLALAAALGRLSKNGVFYGISTFYTSFFRGTPLLLQVMLIYLGLPQVGIVLSAVPAGIIALSLCYGAYMAEIFRAGIEGVPEGQTEAALSLGLKPYQVMRLVILPQALRLVIPPTGNQFISMLKDSSLVSVMGVWELMYLARTHGRSEFKYMEMLISAALIYWALSGIFEFIQSRIEKKLGKGVRV
ncbi:MULTISPECIES: amino acid ABC transporter permease [Thalassospira]|uniref:amino acid ABC transporter permease n=1 Tax=Thalassospira TaxID=168934 RepID=UPI000DFB8BD3|nr:MULTISPECIES: amino acid ABC transporter permease [Thalassospira]RCK31836.1 amino acid ABC transporter permease [Thalassospira xiamenensis]WOI09715.1 amino acid ABC transporter permease [Thalassospira lucentensis]